MTATWILTGDALALRRGDSIEYPSASDIYASVVEGTQIWPDVPPGAQGEAQRLKFNRYALALKATLEAREADQRYFTRLTGNARARTIDVARLPARDHVVVGDDWFAIDPDNLTELRRVSELAGTIPGPVISLRNFLALRRLASTDAPVADATDAAQTSALAFCPPRVGDPQGVHAKLYPYQGDGWRWLRFLAGEGMGGILGDEMGLGKTLQVISLLSDPGGPELRPALIVAPGSLLENWCREFTKFAPELRVCKHHGPTRTGRPDVLRDFDAVITSYDTVIRDGGLFGMIEWPILVLDEAQNIRNPDALRTRAVKTLRRRSAFAVTGTPVENRLSDLWSITDLVLPGHLGTQKEFFGKYGDDVDGATRLEALVSPIMLRRRVAEVATDLPDRIDIPQAIEFEPAEAEAYERVRQNIFERFGSAATLVSLGALRMFCAHPSLVDSRTSDPLQFSKMQRLLEIIEEVFDAHEKVLIFTSYTKMADMIAEAIVQRFGVTAEVLDGRASIDDRQPMIDRLGSASGAGALILNPRAGGAGLNITAANHVIHYNLEWNPALEDQASARAFRRGQSRPVTVHRLFMAGTVEEVVDERVARKRAISAAAVVGIEGKDEDYDDIVAAMQRSPLHIPNGKQR